MPGGGTSEKRRAGGAAGGVECPGAVRMRTGCSCLYPKEDGLTDLIQME